ncbi:MAG: TetR/AcrR family transcriptional regulator [Clostridiales bacterium]|jgi:AcrR family transcriptional regulator|nr:TetR/AcrR family transcriptional regulator [Clostridiales bacterium]
MPKDTFYNLPQEKRERIIEAALMEFEDNSFDQASTNKIIEQSGISKGSFYQYFEDKKDLYKHLIQLMVEAKLKYITPAMQNPFNHDFFEVIHDMNEAGLKFAVDQPRFLKIGSRLMQDKNHVLYREIIAENQDRAFEAYRALVKNAMDRGELRQDLDVDFTARTIFIMSSEIVTFATNGSFETLTEDITEILDKLMNLLAYGIKKTEGKND